MDYSFQFYFRSPDVQTYEVDPAEYVVTTNKHT